MNSDRRLTQTGVRFCIATREMGNFRMIEGKKILVTGGTGMLAGPIAFDLARNNEVWVTSRFANPEMRKPFEDAGMKTCAWILGSDDLSEVPTDIDYVIHAAASISAVGNDFNEAIRQNAEGTGLLMHHCRNAKKFLFVSSIAVYTTPDDPAELVHENSRLGKFATYAASYATSKISAEAVVRTLARIYNLPSIIARMGMAYGTMGWSNHHSAPVSMFEKMLAGKPVPISPRPNYYSLIGEQDILRHIEPLLDHATVPATITSWAGDVGSTEQEICDFMAAAAGITPIYEETWAGTNGHVAVPDPTFRMTITGPNIPWKVGLLEVLRKRFPEMTFRDPA